MINAFGDALEKKSQRKLRIVDVILRDRFPTIFVACYTDTFARDQYFFYKDEIIFPKGIGIENRPFAATEELAHLKFLGALMQSG
jgi:hypothetical protein